jgi:hypothetical protein
LNLFPVLGSLAATILGGVHFGVGGRFTSLTLSMGIMYYIQVRTAPHPPPMTVTHLFPFLPQIILVFVTLLLVIMSYLSWRRAKKNPLHIVPRHSSSSSAYE